MLLSTCRLKVLLPVLPVAFFLCSYLLHDISWAALVSLTVTAVVTAYGRGVVLLFPQLSVNELLHHRARQGTCEYVDENDRLHEQNLPHFWILPLTRFSRENKTSQRSTRGKETTIQPTGGRRAALSPAPPYPRRPPSPALSAVPQPGRTRPVPAEVTPRRVYVPHCATPSAGRRGRLSPRRGPAPRPGGGRRAVRGGAAWPALAWRCGPARPGGSAGV